MGVVTAVGISVNTSYGPTAQRRLEDAMQAALQQAQASGLTPEGHGEAIGLVLRMAHDAELAAIKLETVLARVQDLETQLQQARHALRL